MKLAFIYGGYENLGIQLLSSILKKKGHKTQLFYDGALFCDNMLNVDILANLFDERKILIDEIMRWKPDLVGFSVFTDTYRRELSFAQEIKKYCDIPIIFGGPHPSLLPEKVLSNDAVDMVCIGEAELSLPILAERIELKQQYNDIPGIWTKNGARLHPFSPIKDLNALPFPDKRLFYKKAPYFRKTYSTMTSRGCTFRCTFCNHDSYRKFYGDSWGGIRRRSPENVINELILAKKYGALDIMFEDDMFITDREWTLTFLELYEKRISLPYACICHPLMIDEQIAEALESSGCKIVDIGVQTANERIRKDILNRPETNKQIEKCFKLLIKHNIGINVCQMGGLPEERPEDQEKALLFYSKYKIHRVYYVMLVYYPGTGITKAGLKAGEIVKKDLEAIEDGKSGTYEYSGSVKNPDRFSRYRFIYGFLPLIPKGLLPVLLLLARKSLLPHDPLISKILPAVAGLFIFSKEISVKQYIRRYFYHSIKKMTGFFSTLSNIGGI